MKQDIQNDMKLVNVNADQMQVFVIINNTEIKLNAGVNVKSGLTNVVVIKDLFRIIVYVNVNVISHVIWETIQIMKIVNVEKALLINWLKNVEDVEECKSMQFLYNIHRIVSHCFLYNHRHQQCIFYFHGYSKIDTETLIYQYKKMLYCNKINISE